jgi:hypothetical protein
MARRTGKHRVGLGGAAARGLLVAAALGCCAPGCFGGGGREPISLKARDPASKIPAIKRAADARQTDTAPFLIKSLESDDPAVRFYAIRGLQDLTGETFGYTWYADEQHRRAPLEQWKQWLGANEPAPDTVAGAESNEK